MYNYTFPENKSRQGRNVKWFYLYNYTKTDLNQLNASCLTSNVKCIIRFSATSAPKPSNRQNCVSHFTSFFIAQMSFRHLWSALTEGPQKTQRSPAPSDGSSTGLQRAFNGRELSPLFATKNASRPPQLELCNPQ